MAVQTPSSSTNQTLYAVGILLIMVSAAASYYLLIPKVKDVQQQAVNKEAQQSIMDEQVKSLKNGRDMLAEQEAAYDSKGVDIQKSMEAVMPTYESLPALYIQMEILKAQNTATPFTYVVGSPANDKGGGVRVPVTISAKGTYLDLKKLFTNLEGNIRPISISSISFSPAADPGKSANSNEILSASIQSYVLAQGISPQYEPQAAAQ